jgi:integrase
LPKRDDAIIIPPTLHERQRIYDAAPPHVKRFIILNYNTGARSGASELLKINWEHVDLDAGIITVISANKGGPKLRYVPISDELAEHLVKWRQEDATKRGLDDPALVSGPVVHYRNNPLIKIGKAWRTTLSRAGITRRIRPYDLRHAFATDLIAGGGDIGTVSRLMGHSRPDTTLKIYQHVSSKQEKDVLNRLPRAIKKDDENL